MTQAARLLYGFSGTPLHCCMSAPVGACCGTRVWEALRVASSRQAVGWCRSAGCWVCLREWVRSRVPCVLAAQLVYAGSLLPTGFNGLTCSEERCAVLG